MSDLSIKPPIPQETSVSWIGAALIVGLVAIVLMAITLSWWLREDQARTAVKQWSRQVGSIASVERTVRKSKFYLEVTIRYEVRGASLSFTTPQLPRDKWLEWAKSETIGDQVIVYVNPSDSHEAIWDAPAQAAIWREIKEAFLKWDFTLIATTIVFLILEIFRKRTRKSSEALIHSA